MKKLIFILLLFCSVAKGQTFIVMNKVVRDSLMKIMQSKKAFCDSNHIWIEPVYVMKNKYILQSDIFDKVEWLFIKPKYETKIKKDIELRKLKKEENDSVVKRDKLK